MSISLSARLKVCCSFISPGDRVADIGCDHGYLGIHLLKSGIASSVIAADVNPMPLHSAVLNAEKYGVKEKMTFFLSDGVQNIPHEFDTMVCAGMGADTMISILGAASWLKNSHYRLILQCQSKTPQLRRYLSDQGWCITEETVLRDGKFLYTVMEVQWMPDSNKLTPGQCYFSPALLKSTAPELSEYCQRVLEGLQLAVLNKKEHADPMQIAALQELETNPSLQRLKEENK